MTEIPVHCDCKEAWNCFTILEESILCICVTTGSTESAKPDLSLYLAVLGSSGFRTQFPKPHSKGLCDIR